MAQHWLHECAALEAITAAVAMRWSAHRSGKDCMAVQWPPREALKGVAAAMQAQQCSIFF